LSTARGNAPFTIYDDATALATIRVNQEGAPNDVTMADRVWESLGVYQASSGRLIVTLTDDANGFVNADAIRLVEVPPVVATPELVDDGDTAYAELGENWLGAFSSSSYQGDTRYHSAGTGSNAAQWTFASLPVGQYAVYTTWNVRSNAASNAPFTVYDGYDALATVIVNQRVVPSDISLDGLDWKGLGVFVLASGTARVRVTDLANGFVTADAVRFVCLNAAPVTSGLNPVSVDEDAAPTIVDLTQAFAVDEDAAPTVIDLTEFFADIEVPDSTLALEVIANTNAALFTSVSIVNGELILSHAADAFGTTELTIRATDTGGLSVETVATVMVNSVNDAPTASSIPPLTVVEGTGPSLLNVAAAFADIDDRDPELNFEVTGNTNPAMFSSIGLSPDRDALVLHYAPGVTGSAELTIRATDSGGLWAETTCTVNVLNVHPLTHGIPNVTVHEDALSQTIDLRTAFSDAGTPAALLSYEVIANSRPDLVRVYAGANPWELALHFAPNAFGEAEITVRASDSGGLVVENRLIITVQSVNDAPVIGQVVDALDQRGEPPRIRSRRRRRTRRITVAPCAYTYGSDGRCVSAIETVNGKTSHTAWQYDRSCRLVAEVLAGYDASGSTLRYIDAYTYDLVGNRLTKTRDLGSDGESDERIGYQYDVNDRVLAETQDWLDDADDRFIEYAYGDENCGASQTRQTVYGGLIADPAKKLSETRYGYNLQGRLAHIEIDDGAATQTIDYVYSKCPSRSRCVRTTAGLSRCASLG
jgi:hypothetical protein